MERRTAETRSGWSCCSTARAHAEVQTGIGFLDHMLTALAKHGALRPGTGVRRRPRRRRPSHRGGLRAGAGCGHRPGAGRAARHPAVRPRLRAARRGTGPGRGRLFRPAVGACRSGFPARADRRHRDREPDARVRVAGDRRAHDAARRRAQGHQRPSPRRGRVQGAGAGAARRRWRATAPGEVPSTKGVL